MRHKLKFIDNADHLLKPSCVTLNCLFKLQSNLYINYCVSWHAVLVPLNNRLLSELTTISASVISAGICKLQLIDT